VTRRQLHWGAVVVAIIAALVYAPAIKAPLSFDDDIAIRRNSTIRRLWPISVPLRPPENTPVSGRPVVNYSFALNHALNNALGVDQTPDPGGPSKTVSYHVVNLLLHLGCGLLLFGLLRRTLALPQLASWWSAGGLTAEQVAGAVSALWVLHPIQSEAVNYLTQRTELLVSLCYLATLYAAARAGDAGTVRARRGWSAAAVVACLLGMGSKEVMVSAPLMVVLYDRAFRYPSWRALAARRGFYVALGATWVVLGALLAGAPRAGSVGFQAGMPWYQYLYTQGWAIAHYLRLTLWPDQLVVDYGTRPVTDWRGIPGMLLLGAGLALTLVSWRRVSQWGAIAFLGAWFYLILGPSSSVVPIVTEVAAELLSAVGRRADAPRHRTRVAPATNRSRTRASEWTITFRHRHYRRRGVRDGGVVEKCASRRRHRRADRNPIGDRNRHGNPDLACSARSPRVGIRDRCALARLHNVRAHHHVRDCRAAVARCHGKTAGERTRLGDPRGRDLES
jgi:hypothetical protein